MSDNKKIIDFDEKKLKYENVFSIPIVQYQTTNTEEMNKELKKIILKKEKENPTTSKRDRKRGISCFVRRKNSEANTHGTENISK